MRDQIVERLTGATGDPKAVEEAARSVGERCVPEIMTAFEEAFAIPVALECGTVEITRLADARPAPGGFGAMTIATSGSSPDALLIAADADALAIAVCGMFGADEDMPVVPIGRPLSSIEIDVAAQLFEMFATAFNGSGERSFGIRFPLHAPLTGEEIETQVIRDGPAARIVFDLVSGECRGHVAVTIPQRVLVEHRGEGRAKASNAVWRERFSEEVMRSAVTLRATIPLAKLTLGQIASLRPGQVLELTEHAPTQAKLSAGDQTLFLCEFGKLGQNYTVRVVQPFDAQQDFVEGLLTA
jgi:flagellar motor switch protein FliM